MSEELAQALGESSQAELVETHISWLILGRETVYKLKKPVDLGFLDFSTLEKRRRACEDELRLNRRTAPHIYEAVVPVSGTESAPLLDDDSAVIDYALRMRRFDNSKQLDRLAGSGALGADAMDALAEAVAGFHDGIRGAEAPADCGTPEAILAPARENFEALAELDHHAEDQALLDELREWTEQEYRRREADFATRREQGFVRECHGDLHLGNIYYADGRAVPFDCIEFSAALRWIDVMADIAFTVMDLINHDLPALGYRLLNEYLARTGDYGGVRVLRWYLVYRAIIRAKVAAIRAGQDKEHAGELDSQCSHYLQLAGRLAQPGESALILMCGLSGTGKTTIARDLAGDLEAIHLRSDVERKRLHGLAMTDSSHESGLDIYTRQASERTFSHLEQLTADVLACDLPVIVDATFIGRALRRRFTDLARRLSVPWLIVECTATEEQVRERLAARSGDASEAGLQQYIDQREAFEPFTDDELRRRLVVDSEAGTGGLADRVLDVMNDSSVTKISEE
ncbi:MAG: AAA family ATPase [Pseudohongiellaceae bacterium]